MYKTFGSYLYKQPFLLRFFLALFVDVATNLINHFTPIYIQLSSMCLINS